MSKTYEKVGNGRFFENDQGGNEKRPLFKGTSEINGVEFDIALWPRTAKSNGSRFLSIQFSVKGARESVGDGALFLRDQKSPKAPAFSGPLEVGGRKFEGSVWRQTSEKGNEYYSLKIETVTEEA
jgi:uncharacterized protein (DUF736 family)